MKANDSSGSVENANFFSCFYWRCDENGDRVVMQNNNKKLSCAALQKYVTKYTQSHPRYFKWLIFQLCVMIFVLLFTYFAKRHEILKTLLPSSECPSCSDCYTYGLSSQTGYTSWAANILTPNPDSPTGYNYSYVMTSARWFLTFTHSVTCIFQFTTLIKFLDLVRHSLSRRSHCFKCGIQQPPPNETSVIFYWKFHEQHSIFGEWNGDWLHGGSWRRFGWWVVFSAGVQLDLWAR